LQVVAFATAGADVQTELGEGFVVFVLQDFGDVRLFVGKEVMEHARTESRFGGEQAHGKLAVAVAGVEGFAGGDESVTRVSFGRVGHGSKVWTVVQEYKQALDACPIRYNPFVYRHPNLRRCL